MAQGPLAAAVAVKAGAYAPLQEDSNGNLKVAIAANTQAGAKATYYSGNTTSSGNVTKNVAGILYGLHIDTAGNQTWVDLYDGGNTSGTLLGNYSANATGSFTFGSKGVAFATGLVTVNSASADGPTKDAKVTVIWE